jgi:stage II sporulation SpoE-like protein
LPDIETDPTPDRHDGTSGLLSELVSHRLPAAVLREAHAAGAGRAAVFVVDIDGSCLIRLAGDEDFPDRIQTPLGVGPELAPETFDDVKEIVTSKVPDATLHPLWVRDRAVGMLVACGGDQADLRSLADQGALALELGSGYTDVIHRVRRRKQISAAAEIQQNLLPPRIANLDGARLAGGVLPGYQVGGDFFDYAENEDGLWLALGDAMGKGNAAAAMSSLALGALRSARRNDATLEQAAEAVHDATFELGGAYHFLTAVLAIWHRDTGVLACINCGHPPPMLLERGGAVRDLAGETTYPLGMVRRERAFHRIELPTEPGQRILLYSDGIPERRDDADQLFGMENVRRTLRECADASAAGAVRALQDEVLGFSASPLRDDATILLVDIASQG